MPETVPCKTCGKALAEGDRFCPGCGTTVAEPMETAVGQVEDHGTNPTQCVSCGSAMGRDDQFCPKCGTSRPEEATVVSHVSLRNAQAAHLIDATKGEFEVIRQLGTGAMGAVYLAKDIALGRQVAIKVIAPNLLSDDTMISRFRLEAQTVASLRHPNIVNVHAVRQSDDLHYFVMEFIDGPPLRSIVKGHAPLDVEVVQALLFQMGSALSYAHRTGGGVIHRDIKPANIMLDREGNTYVTDFGISKIAEAKSGLTQTGATIGTPEYMSPEQCRGEPLTGASDQYALGIVAYEMLCGHTPFSGAQYYIMVAHTSEAPKPIMELRPDCPKELAETVERMLAKTPEERWPDLDSAAAAAGGAPMPFKSPIRTKIITLTGATLLNVKAIDTGSSQASSGPASLETATSVTVKGIPSVVETGDSFTLEADVRGTGESALAGMGVIWASTDPSIAKVEGGVVEAISPGSVSITATAGNVASSVLLTVADPLPAAVLVRPGSVRIQRGGRIGLKATVQDRKGRELDRAVRWRTSDTEVATVTEDGQVVATGGGAVSIVAETDGVTGSAEIIVDAPMGATAPQAAIVSPPKAKAKPKAPAPKAPAPKATPPKAPPPQAPAPKAPAPKAPAPKAPAPAKSRPSPPRPRPQPAGAPPLYRRPAAIAASVIGLLLVGFGVISIVGGDGGTPSDPSPEPPIAAEPAPGGAPTGPGVLTAGDPTAQPGAPAGANPGQPDGGAAPDPVGPEPATVTVTNDPPVSAAQPPPTTPPTAATAPPPPPTTAAPPPTTPTPTPPPAAAPPTPGRVEIGLDRTAMVVDETQGANANVFTADGGRLFTGFSLDWRSTDNGVISVTPEGTVRASGPGSAWLVATAGRALDSILVSVAGVVAGVEITGSDFSLEVGDARTLSAAAVDSNGGPMDRTITWSSSNTQAVAVDATSGRVTAQGPGTARVSASADGYSAEVEVTVAAAAPALPSASEVASAINGYVATLSGGDEDAVRRLWGADENGLDDVLDLMGERSFSAALSSQGDPAVQGAAAVVSFGVRGSFRNFAGGDRTQDLNFVARLEYTGSAWSLVSARVQ